MVARLAWTIVYLDRRATIKARPYKHWLQYFANLNIGEREAISNEFSGI